MGSIYVRLRRGVGDFLAGVGLDEDEAIQVRSLRQAPGVLRSPPPTAHHLGHA